ncbi:FtsB family cell division protein [Ilumatobacter sp.]|uniref:FtsB family cell division protein n=1 Tax=Ilumatobacter sp. TaxID=1967498 RepID=UPI003AF91665
MSAKGTSTIERPEGRRASDHGRSRLGDVTRPIHVDRRITTQRRSTILLAVVALAIAGALAAALFVLPVQTYFAQDERLEQREEQLAQLEQVNADLRAEVERLRTDDGVREAAREELGMVREGELRQSILDLPAVPTDLPVGWPYSLVTGIAEVRRNPPPTQP